MRLELVRTVKRGDHAEIEDAAASAIESGPVPDRIPAIFGGELLHRPAEVVRSIQRLVDIGVAQDRTPGFQPMVKPLAPLARVRRARGSDFPRRSLASLAAPQTV